MNTESLIHNLTCVKGFGQKRSPHLAVAGVYPRVAQQAMRHSRMELTNQYYTDPILLDVAGAVNSLPDFSASEAASPINTPRHCASTT
jgi:hypothetical protein